MCWCCVCGLLCSDACFALWESKHKGSLRGSARVLAALLQQPQLLKPLLQQPDATGAFREVLAALPARHRSHLATGKGWQVGAVMVCPLNCRMKCAVTFGPPPSLANLPDSSCHGRFCKQCPAACASSGVLHALFSYLLPLAYDPVTRRLTTALLCMCCLHTLYEPTTAGLLCTRGRGRLQQAA
jgi:hypothetical protein